MVYENTELVNRAKAGDQTAAFELLQYLDHFTWKQANRWARALGDASGCTAEDFHQAGWIALVKALEYYTQDKGNFTNVYAMCLKTAFSQVAGIRTERDKNDPLRYAVGLNDPIKTGGNSDSGAPTIGDIIADSKAAEAFFGAEHSELVDAVQNALQSLTEPQRTVIHMRYWEGLTAEKASSAMGITTAKARALERDAIRKLRHPTISKVLQRYL